MFQSSQLKSSRSQLKQRTTKERKELKEIMRKKIESMRSTVSANGKYPAAVNTPIIYDQVSVLALTTGAKANHNKNHFEILRTRDAPELGSGRLVPAGTPIFLSSGSGRNS